MSTITGWSEVVTWRELDSTTVPGGNFVVVRAITRGGAGRPHVGQSPYLPITPHPATAMLINPTQP
ncbi:MAG TPA: hypothetical protein VFE62_15360 [Gemmataceae bacterium]|nr:hypothetical protein [Gemmataceae bacterium]